MIRSRLALVPACCVALLAGCQQTPAPAEPEPTPEAEPFRPPAQTPPEEVEAACGPLERPPVQGGEHLIGDQDPPVPYSSTPPTSGWHSSGAFEITVQAPDDPLSEPRHVSILEAGGVVVAYHDIDDAERQSIEQLVRDQFDGRAAVTPYEQLPPGHIAMTGWGVVQRCDRPDLDAVAAFIQEHADEDPAIPGHH